MKDDEADKSEPQDEARPKPGGDAETPVADTLEEPAGAGEPTESETPQRHQHGLLSLFALRVDDTEVARMQELYQLNTGSPARDWSATRLLSHDLLLVSQRARNMSEDLGEDAGFRFRLGRITSNTINQGKLMRAANRQVAIVSYNAWGETFQAISGRASDVRILDDGVHWHLTLHKIRYGW